MVRKTVNIIVLICLLLFCACHRPTDTNVTDELAQANQLIDDGKYQEAVDLLNKLRQKEPQNQMIAVTAASAYISQAGLSTINFILLVHKLIIVDLTERESRTTEMLHNMQGLNMLAGGTNDSLTSMIAGLSATAIIVYRLNQLPKLTPAQSANLQTALKIMDNIPDIRAGPALYRAVLNLFYLKNDFETRIAPQLIKPVGQTCGIDIGGITTVAQNLYSHLQRIGHDLYIGFPSQKQGIDKALNDFAKVVNDLLALQQAGQMFQADINYWRESIFHLPPLTNQPGCLLW